MSKVKHIAKQIEERSQSEFAELRCSILERDREPWDAQIEEDTRAGKRDKSLREAEEDYRLGRTREL